MIEYFAKRLERDWLEPFCLARGFSTEGFDQKGLNNLSLADAADFILAIESGLVTHKDGTFLAAQSRTKEQIFWEGPRASQPRKITVWLEPIITMAGLLRLARDFHWPQEQLGLQSSTWAFDLVAYDKWLKSEVLACEVKKSEKEIDKLVEFMHQHLTTPTAALGELKGAERNALKKVAALRDSSCSTFWALGPNRYGFIFDVAREKEGSISLIRTTESALVAPNNSFKPSPLRGLGTGAMIEPSPRPLSVPA